MNKALARAKRPDSDEYVAQVRDIAERIAKGTWVLAVTEQEKALEWGVDISSVRRRAAEARRLVESAFGDLSDLRTDICAQLSGIAGEQRHKEARTAVSALVALATITGVMPTRYADTRAPSAKALTAEARRAEINRIRAQLDEADAALALEEGTVDVPSEGDGT
jgi:hypothetical protein